MASGAVASAVTRFDVKRASIVGGAKDVFLRHGFEGASMDEIAAAAGVSKMTVYRYFRSKEQLFAGVIRDLCERIIDEDLERSRVACDVELIPRRRIEGTATICPDLRPDPALAQERECPPRRGAAAEVEMQSPVACGTKVQAAGRVEERRELREPVARALRRDRGELFAYVLRGDHRTTPSSASNRRFTSTPASP